LARLRLRHLELDDELALGERGAARPGHDLLDRDFAAPVRAGDDRQRARGDDRRHAVGGRRGVAQIAGDRGAALDLRRADQVDPLDDAGPGVLEALVGADHDARRGAADHEKIALLADADDARNALGIDDQVRLQPAAFQLDQEVGPPRQHFRLTGGSGQGLDGLVDRRRRRVADPRHVRS